MLLAALDQVPVFSANGAGDAAQEAVRLASDVERAGYHRFWIAEHHGVTSGCGAPEVLVAAAAMATTGIRVGAGAVLLPYYSPFKVAATFNLLSRLFPGRIDLGVGRGPGGDPATGDLLAPEPRRPFEEKLAELVYAYGDDRRLARYLPQAQQPEMWMMASSRNGALCAAQHGMALCLAQFVHQRTCPELLDVYRENFRPRTVGDRPRTSVCVRLACAEDLADVQALAGFYEWVRSPQAYRSANTDAPTRPTWQKCREIARPLSSYKTLDILVGRPEQTMELLTAVVDAYRPDELAVTTACPPYALRARTFELLSEMCTQHGAQGGGIPDTSQDHSERTSIKRGTTQASRTDHQPFGRSRTGSSTRPSRE